MKQIKTRNYRRIVSAIFRCAGRDSDHSRRQQGRVNLPCEHEMVVNQETGGRGGGPHPNPTVHQNARCDCGIFASRATQRVLHCRDPTGQGPPVNPRGLQAASHGAYAVSSPFERQSTRSIENSWVFEQVVSRLCSTHTGSMRRRR